MHVVITPSKPKGKVKAPPSKSYTHRAFILATLARGESRIINYLFAKDTLATLKACEALGAEIKEENENYAFIKGTGGKLKTPEEIINVGNSGTTLRLISGIACLDRKVTLDGDESIRKRPMKPLLDALSQLDIKVISNNGKAPLTIYGKEISKQEVKIRGDISSQFISSLLILAPYTKKGLKLKLTTELKSKPYVDITLDIMKKFGVEVENKDYQEFYVAPQLYKATEYRIEGDYSSASYFLALAAITNSEITVENLRKNTKQGDRVILDILKEMGAKVVIKEDAVVVKGNELNGIEVDLGNTPDLLPTVVALACIAKGKTVIKNIKHARYKECDRVRACSTEFRKFGVEIEEKEDMLIVKGKEKEKLKGCEVNSHKDHRMAMALSLLACIASKETVIKNAECVSISYPKFFDELRKLGVSLWREIPLVKNLE
ncbi:MAG: 3-phosphoshikimate 1-carboxyvinyltransferase [Candidatus Hydrothermarchaeota archaeon]|nr:MAG: 3-phosphoshikimate 1-carboxyvinyltransferase [Candidatus Hydrothermarchaeota archaeon]